MHEVCNWLIPADIADQFCPACQHNRMVPDLTQNLVHWRYGGARHYRLFYTLLKLRLPLVTKAQDPNGLAFDFLADGPLPVFDAERERRRHQTGEPYRTLLGHFRHEIAHYYWTQLVAKSPSLGEFREPRSTSIPMKAI
jgi:hypothetical protein